MQPSDNNLWGPTSMLSDVSVGFEDSFSLPTTLTENGSNDGGSSYIPLQDSSQYLAGLERKLARVQGRTSGQRKAESRRLIEALAGTRSAHVSQLMQGAGAGPSVGHEEEQTPVRTSATVDPQGALGMVLRRVAPEKVAVAPEELCRLLEADILANIHQGLHETPNQDTQNTEGTTSKKGCEDQVTEKATIKISKSSVEQKDPSSDEGEK